MKNLFAVGINYTLPKKTIQIIEIVGSLILLSLWFAITYFEIVPKATLPSPMAVLKSFPELHFEDALIRNVGLSFFLNFLGYIEAVAIAIPLGFLIALIPGVRYTFNRYVDAIRFLPLTAMTGLFIAWFGIGIAMKVNFLALGIIVYLLPVVIQRVFQTEKVHLDTMWTLNSSTWQTFRYVYFPATMSKLFDDIRVIVAMSWTYIIIAEMLNNSGGVGSMIWLASRQSKNEKVWALLIIIMFIGFIQDKIFKFADKKIFKFKYVNK